MCTTTTYGCHCERILSLSKEGAAISVVNDNNEPNEINGNSEINDTNGINENNETNECSEFSDAIAIRFFVCPS